MEQRCTTVFNVTWGQSHWRWAPCVERKDGVYYLYYPHKDDHDDWRVGIVTASQPQGPFTDTGSYIEGLWGIDPMVFTDDDGESYSYTNDHEIAKLKPNMIEIAKTPVAINYGPPEIMGDDELGFEEGSYMHKKDGVYYYS